MKTFVHISKILFSLAFILATANLPAQTFMTLHNFALPEGIQPSDNLLLSNGILYGATIFGATNSDGAIYSINTDGTDFDVLYSFTNGQPHLLTLLDGTLYATTSTGGASNYSGTICSVGRDGSNGKTIYQFTGSGNGAMPTTLVAGSNLLYGTTQFGSFGGNPPLPSGGGILYSIDTNGNNFKILHTFNSGQAGESLLLKDNLFYGTTIYTLEIFTNAVIFSMDLSGNNYTNLYVFTNGMGVYQMIFHQGLLYGLGISNNAEADPGGFIFSINTNGSNLNVLHTFANAPYFLLGSSNLLWGGTEEGGFYNGGIIFSMKTNGDNFNIIYNLPNNRNVPYGGGLSGLILSGSTLLGTTSLDGTNNSGSIFDLNPAPIIQSFAQSTGTFNMQWSAVSNATYQLQYSTNLIFSNWLNLGNTLTATTSNLFFSDSTTNSQRFYRLIYQP